MNIYAISDFHLSLGADKPMEVFGNHWEKHFDKIKENCSVIKDDDILLIAGDVSWATYLAHAIEDFSFINSLPGRKIISKGNHDYWWETLTKQYNFLSENNFSDIDFIHNNSYVFGPEAHKATGVVQKSIGISAGDVAICGAKGATTADEAKIYNREQERLKLSLKSANDIKTKIVMLHYPPDESFREILKEFDVSICIYGHIHNNFNGKLPDEIDGIKYYLTSCDYLNFKPIKIL